MNLLLDDQVVVVVGAASGIGKAIATEFTNENAKVCWLDIDPAVVETASASVPADQPQPFSWTLDATDYSRVERVAAQIHDQFGRCDHVVVAIGAGSGKYGFPFWNLAPADWHRVIEVNLIGAVNVAHAFVPLMLTQRQGTICFLSSVAGQIGSQTDPPYSAAKAGLINFAQCAAKDLASYGIRVNVVSPGMVKTPLNQSVWQAWRETSPSHTSSYDDWAEQKISRISPLARWQEPEDVAAAVVFLASARARNVTGQTFNVDGGQVMHS